jgi:hypothetical protein
MPRHPSAHLALAKPWQEGQFSELLQGRICPSNALSLGNSGSLIICMDSFTYVFLVVLVMSCGLQCFCAELLAIQA